jgi:tetratricopeptide (TPR) repeat protein
MDAMRRGESIRAEQYMSMAIEAGYDQRRALPLLLRICLQSSRLRSALDHAEPYLLQHPEDKVLRYLVSTIHLSLGQIDAARLGLEELLRTNAEDADAHYLLGILEMRRAPSEASHHLHMYMALAPTGVRSAEAKSRLLELDARSARTVQSVNPNQTPEYDIQQHAAVEAKDVDNVSIGPDTVVPGRAYVDWETTDR